jgi:hypothetical protein
MEEDARESILAMSCPPIHSISVSSYFVIKTHFVDQFKLLDSHIRATGGIFFVLFILAGDYWHLNGLRFEWSVLHSRFNLGGGVVRV